MTSGLSITLIQPHVLLMLMQVITDWNQTVQLSQWAHDHRSAVSLL